MWKRWLVIILVLLVVLVGHISQLKNRCFKEYNTIEWTLYDGELYCKTDSSPIVWRRAKF